MRWMVPGVTRLGRAYKIQTEAPPVEYINAFDYTIHDGSYDDTSGLNAACGVANAQGKVLYMPSANYKVSDWSPPQGSTIVGDGGLDFSTHVLGRTIPRNNTTFTGVDFGISTTSAIRIAYDNPGRYITFNNCRFRGGGAPIVQEWSAYGWYDHITFNYCVFEVPYFTSFTPLAHCVSMQVDCTIVGSGHGGVLDYWTFDHCHFGVPNEYSQTETKYGHILYYRHNNSQDNEDAYVNNLSVTHNIFENAWNWAIDYTGNSEDEGRPHPIEYQHAIITDNILKGNGGHRPEQDSANRFPIGLDLEPVYQSSIERNVIMRCDFEAIKLTFTSKECDVKDNHIDYRPNVDADVYVSSTNPTSSSTYNYWYNRVIRLYGGYGFTVTGNTYYLPTNWKTYADAAGGDFPVPPDNSHWIYDESTSSTVSGNHVYVNDDVVDWESTMDVGPY